MNDNRDEMNEDGKENCDDNGESTTLKIVGNNSTDKVEKYGIKVSEEMRHSLQTLRNAEINYMKTIGSIFKQQDWMKAFEPMRRIQAQIDLSGLEIMKFSLQNYYNERTTSLAKSITPIMGESLQNFVRSYNFDIAEKFQFPIQQFLREIDFTPLYRTFEQLKGLDFSKYREKLNKVVLTEMYDAKWFPHALSIDDGKTFTEFWEILGTTKKSRNRIRKIDGLIFEKYDKKTIERIKKKWREKNIPEHKMRMMHQAVQAYHRKEYAITVVMLSTLWEGIIYDKSKDTRGKNGRRTKEDFGKLISQTNYDIVFASFFDEYIMYDCRSVEEVKEDVPGRNSSAHSWYSKYPSKKAGLNAILFTDFLLNLEPLKEDYCNGKDENGISGYDCTEC